MPKPGMGHAAVSRPECESNSMKPHESGRGRVERGSGGEAGRLLPVRDRQAGDPAPAEIGAAAHRQQGRRRHAAFPSTTNACRPSSRCWACSFKNTSGLHLMQGPITVFEGSNYAGDARILDLQPNEERLHFLRRRPGHRGQSRAQQRQWPDHAGQGRQGHAAHHHQAARNQDLHHQEPQRARTDSADRASGPQRLQTVSTDKPLETASDSIASRSRSRPARPRSRPSPRSGSCSRRCS